VIDRQHVVTHQGFHQLIGSPFARVLVGRHLQQIGIREAIPIAPGQGAVAEGLSAGVQPDAAIVGPEGVVQGWRSAEFRRCRSRRRRGAKVLLLAGISQSYGRRDSTALTLAIL
jgi:hypothetical protein